MKRKKLPATSYWPGYVDALVNVVLNVLFFVGLMAVGLVTINIEALSSYKGAKQAQDLRNISEGHMLLAALGTLLAAIPLPTDNQPKPKAQAEPPPPAPKVEVATSAAPASKEARNFKATDISDRINSAVFSVGTPLVVASVKQEQTHVQGVLDKEGSFQPVPVVLEFEALQYHLTDTQNKAVQEVLPKAEPQARWVILVTVPQVQERAPRESYWRMSEVRQVLTQAGVPEADIQMRTVTQAQTNYSNGRRVFLYTQAPLRAKGS
jgi:hypothetical protein